VLRRPVLNLIRPTAVLTVAVAGVVAAAGALPAQAARVPAGRTAAAAPGWRITRTFTTKNTFLDDVVAFHNGTAWASGETPAQTPVLYHLTGTGWHAVALPGPTGSFVSNVNASSPTNVWATIANEPDVAHLTSHGWVLVSFADGSDDVLMDGLATTSPRNVWVFTYDFTTKLPYAHHFNGSSWKTTQLPAIVDGNSLTELVSASSADNIWTLADKGSATVTMRYNGHKWQTFPLPASTVPAGQMVFVRQILAESASNVWIAVWTAKGEVAGPVVLMHWNGHHWSKAAGKPPAGVLSGPIAPDGRGGLWLGAQSGTGSPFFLHYRAGVWTRFRSPTNSRGPLTLSALVLIPRTRSLFGVGDLGANFGGDNGAAILKFGR
jgi:hypothetical protein